MEADPRRAVLRRVRLGDDGALPGRETLFTVTFTDEVFEAEVDAGVSDDTKATKALAAHILKHVPKRPPAAKE